MTREEAILLSAYTGFLLAPDFSEVHKFCENTLGRPIWTHEFARPALQNEIQEKLRPQIMELVQSIFTLRPASREQVEKVWRGEWNVIYDELNGFTYVTCSKCRDETVLNGCFVTVEGEPCDLEDFCPHCGAAMTDEAMQMVMKRLEAVYEQDND